MSFSFVNTIKTRRRCRLCFHFFPDSHACTVDQSGSCVRPFVSPWAHQTSLSFTTSRSLLKPMSIELVMPSNQLILYCPYSFCLQSFLASGSLPVSWLFSSGGQSIVASTSASVLPMNTQGWFPLGLTGWVALPSKGLSGVFSNTTVKKDQFFDTQPSL